MNHRRALLVDFKQYGGFSSPPCVTSDILPRWYNDILKQCLAKIDLAIYAVP